MRRACLVLLGLAGSLAWAADVEVQIITDPPGAEVWRGPVRLGITGSEGLRVVTETGTIVYSIRKPGYLTVEKTIEVEPRAEPLTVRIHLEAEAPEAKASPGAGKPTEAAAQAPPRPPEAPEAASTPTEKKHGSHKGLILGLGGGAAAAAGVGIALLTKTDPRDVDGDHDGFTPKQADCNDNDPQIHPGGAFSIRVTPDLTGAISCNTEGTSINVFATNLDCTPVTVSSAAWLSSHTSGRCSGGDFYEPIPVTASTVAPGAKDVVIASKPLHFLGGCCGRGDCGPSDTVCGWTESYTVVTSKGTFAQTNSYTMTFPAGHSCQACQSSSSVETRACLPLSRPLP